MIRRTIWTRNDPPPPPLTPHPEVLKELSEIREPETKLCFGTKPKPVPLQLVAILTSTNQKQIPRLLENLASEAASCSGVKQFLTMVKSHRSRIHLLVVGNRTTAAAYCKKNKLSGKILQACKFGFFKRMSVWRDSVDDLLKLAERSAQWNEERRNFLW